MTSVAVRAPSKEPANLYLLLMPSTASTSAPSRRAWHVFDSQPQPRIEFHPAAGADDRITDRIRIHADLLSTDDVIRRVDKRKEAVAYPMPGHYGQVDKWKRNACLPNRLQPPPRLASLPSGSGWVRSPSPRRNRAGHAEFNRRPPFIRQAPAHPCYGPA